MSKPSSSECHRGAKLGDKKDSKSEKSHLFSLEAFDSATPGKKKLKTGPELTIADSQCSFHSPIEPLPGSSTESQRRPVLSTLELKLEPVTTHTNDQSGSIKMHEDDNLFEVPLPPG